MNTWTVGDFRIERIVDFEAPIFPPGVPFPDLRPETLEANRDWLVPRYIDPERGLLRMSYHAYLVRTPSHTMLIDTCLGNHKERPAHGFMHRRNGPFLGDLIDRGVRPEDIDFVLCTHLHVDHVGWNTRLVDGRWVPTFPKAKYVFARREYAYWEAQKRADPGALVNHGAYEDSVLPVVAAGQAVLVESDHAVEDGIWLEPAPGHTTGSVFVNLRSREDSAVCAGDAIIHALQIADPSLSSRFCEDPAQSRATRRRLVERIAGTPTRLMPAHFPDPVVGRIVAHGSGFRFEG